MAKNINYQQVEAVLAPFLGILQAGRSGDSVGQQNNLKQMLDAMETATKIKRLQLDVAKMPSEIAYSEALAGQAQGLKAKYGQDIKESEAKLARESKIREILLSRGIDDPAISKAILDATEATTAQSTLKERETQGYFPAKVGQETQESRLAGQIAEQEITQGVPALSTGATVAKAQADIETVIPMAQGEVTEQQRDIDIKGKELEWYDRYKGAQISNLNEPPSSGMADFLTASQRMSAFNQLSDNITRNLDKISGLEAQKRAITSGQANNSMIAQYLAGMNLASTGNPDQDKQNALAEIDRLILEYKGNTVIQKKQAKQYGIDAFDTGEKTTGVTTGNFTQSQWNAFGVEGRARARKTWGNNIRIIPDKPQAGTQPIQTKPKPTSSAKPAETGNAVKVKQSSRGWSKEEEDALKRLE